MFSLKQFISDGKDGLISVSLHDDYIKEHRFWKLSSKDNRIQKDWCNAFNRGNSHEFMTKWLPAFGFGRYKNDSDNVEDDGLIVQQLGYFIGDELKRGEKVSIIGDQRDPDVKHKIMNWTVEGLRHLEDVAGLTVPKNLVQEIHQFKGFFENIHIFLPYLKDVGFEDEGTGKWTTDKQRPATDNDGQGLICFSNRVVFVRENDQPFLGKYTDFRREKPQAFFWEDDIKSHEINESINLIEPRGHWWDFLQNLSKESINDEWVINRDILNTIVSAYGYLMHDYFAVDNRKVIVLYDRTINEREGRNGKGIISRSLEHHKKTYWIDMKTYDKKKSNFLFDGYREDMRIIRFEDIPKKFDLDRIFNVITDGMEVEGKNRSKKNVAQDRLPKCLITTNYPIPRQSNSESDRQFFVPIGTYYSQMKRNEGKTPVDIHGVYLAKKGRGRKHFTKEDWDDFYATCAYCLQQYLNKGLIPFEDSVLEQQQLSSICFGDEYLQAQISRFIQEVFDREPPFDGLRKNECTKDEVHKVFDDIELEHLKHLTDLKKTKVFTDYAREKGIELNLGCPNGRNQHMVDGVPRVDCFHLTPPRKKNVDGSLVTNPLLANCV